MTMKKRFCKDKFILISVLLLISCDGGHVENDRDGCVIPERYKRVLASADDQYQLWQIRTVEGGIRWNGVAVTEAELTSFAHELSNRAASTGSVVYEVNDEASCEDRLKIRSALAKSGLCEQSRCWEVEGEVKVPTVH